MYILKILKKESANVTSFHCFAMNLTTDLRYQIERFDDDDVDQGHARIRNKKFPNIDDKKRCGG